MLCSEHICRFVDDINGPDANHPYQVLIYWSIHLCRILCCSWHLHWMYEINSTKQRPKLNDFIGLNWFEWPSSSSFGLQMHWSLTAASNSHVILMEMCKMCRCNWNAYNIRFIVKDLSSASGHRLICWNYEDGFQIATNQMAAFPTIYLSEANVMRRRKAKDGSYTKPANNNITINIIVSYRLRAIFFSKLINNNAFKYDAIRKFHLFYPKKKLWELTESHLHFWYHTK